MPYRHPPRAEFPAHVSSQVTAETRAEIERIADAAKMPLAAVIRECIVAGLPRARRKLTPKGGDE